jgi:hypothetical protein
MCKNEQKQTKTCKHGRKSEKMDGNVLKQTKTFKNRRKHVNTEENV